MSLGDWDTEAELRRTADPDLLREWMEEDEFEDGSDELDWLLNAREAQATVDAEAAESLRRAQELLAASETEHDQIKPVVERLLADVEDDGPAFPGTMAAARKPPRTRSPRRERAARKRVDLARIADRLPSDFDPAA